MQPIIEVKSIGKKYAIAHQRGGYIALRDVLTGIITKPFRFIKTKLQKVIGKDTKEPFWALKDISFNISRGEVVGIIGHNGAGKSTLLKILSQITPPTTGEIKIRGRVGSLLEVGTGFHPELTGRENIFLNGAILGMKKKEIEEKFSEIVSFAGIEQFLDTPVKYYSSGMYVRLAFSVAAHLDPDILIIDEVLAVGDAEFQKKCLGKMEEITGKEGRTILFVSHNMDAIRRLCKKTILIAKGEVKKIGETDDVINTYISLDEHAHELQDRWENTANTYAHKYFTPTLFELQRRGKNYVVRIEGSIEELHTDLTIGYALYDQQGQLLFWSYQTDAENRDKPLLQIGENTLTSILPVEFLNNGTYRLELIGGIHQKEWLLEPGKEVPTLFIRIERDFNTGRLWNEKRPGILAPVILWKN